MESIARILSQHQQLYKAENGSPHFVSQNHIQRTCIPMSYIYAEMVLFFLHSLSMFERGASQGTLLFYVQHFQCWTLPVRRSRRPRNCDTVRNACLVLANDCYT
jgi:hypothetical protein